MIPRKLRIRQEGETYVSPSLYSKIEVLFWSQKKEHNKILGD